MKESLSTPAPRRNAVLAVMCLALVMVVANVSMLNVGVRSISLDIGATSNQLHWIVDSYAVAFAALLLPFGALGDRFGRRTTMLIGMVIMTIAALIAATSDTAGTLIAARVVAGISAALVMPGTLSTITQVFPAEERGRAVGIWAGFASAGGILGVLAGGVLLEVASWPALFWFSAALAVVAMAGTIAIVPNTSNPDHAHLDPIGSVLCALAIGAVIFGIIEGPVEGWAAGKVLGALTIGAIAAIAFVFWELRVTHPVLDVRLFGNRAFSAGATSIFLQFFAAFGFFFVAALFTQTMLGYSPLKSALALLPMSAIIVPLSAKSPDLARRFGLRAVNASGLGLMAAGFIVMTTMNGTSGYWHFLGGLFLFGAGLALSTAPASESIVNSLPHTKQGVASAVNDTARELGGALGIAAIGSAFTSGYEASINGLIAKIPGLPSDLAAGLRSSPIAGVQIASKGATSETGRVLLAGVRDSFMDGMGRGLFIGAAALICGVVLVLLRSPKTVTRPVDEFEAGSPARPVTRPRPNEPVAAA